MDSVLTYGHTTIVEVYDQRAGLQLARLEPSLARTDIRTDNATR